MFSPNNLHLIGLPEIDLQTDSVTIFQSNIIHETKSASTLHILMNTLNHEIYERILLSSDALQALENLIELSMSSSDSENFDKIVQFLNANIS